MSAKPKKKANGTPAAAGEQPKTDLMLYQTEDGKTRVEVRLAGETVWLTQAQMAELFQRERSVIAKHILNVFAERELDRVLVAEYPMEAVREACFNAVVHRDYTAGSRVQVTLKETEVEVRSPGGLLKPLSMPRVRAFNAPPYSPNPHIALAAHLEGGAGNRVLKLITPFGGGKSHTLASLYHAARHRSALDVIPEGKALPRPGTARTAVFDGQFFSAVGGKDMPGTKLKAKTMWGWIAWSLGNEAGYELMRAADEAQVAPGGDDITKLLGDAPNLILLDEVLEYLISAGGINISGTT